jgi:putative transcriptional regulator
MPSDPLDLRHQLLIAMPAMADPNFSGSVVYICDHGEGGSLGLVINRPTELNLSTLFERIELKLEIAPWKDTPVFFGGPVQTERGFVLHVPRAAQLDAAGHPEISLTTSKDVLEAVRAAAVRTRCWLRLVIQAGVPGSSKAKSRPMPGSPCAPHRRSCSIFRQKSATRLLKLLGVDATQLSGQVGHA